MTKKILIITQKVDRDDQILGFFHHWIEEFSTHFDKLTVICLEQGRNDLPEKIKVLSLGKESNLGKVNYLFNFYKYLWQERDNYDSVFVHMNPIYIVIAGAYWRLAGKKIALWYTHKKVDWKLRLAEKLANIIFSASAESFRLFSKKLTVTGHGIDTELFRPKPKEDQTYTIISVGRLARTKNHHLLVKAVSYLTDLNKPWRLLIVGEAIYPEDFIYKKELIDLINENKLGDRVELVGSVFPSEMVKYYQRADLLVNLSDTGSLDKVVLEAMSCGVRIISSNEAYSKILSRDFFVDKDPVNISLVITKTLLLPVDVINREYVVENHNLTKLINLLVRKMENL